MSRAQYILCWSLLALLGCNRPVVNNHPQRLVFAVASDDPKQLTIETLHTEPVESYVIGALGDQQIMPQTITWIEKVGSRSAKKRLTTSSPLVTPNGDWIAYVHANFDLELAIKAEQAKSTQQSPEAHRLPPGAYGIRIGRDESNGLHILEILNAAGRNFIP